jgi:MoaA/NifB/PqqE/SkfB family radical SAM enzyme
MSTAVREAVEDGTIGERVWFYANYHCNLECTYCLTDSGPSVPRRLLDAGYMVERAHEARDLGFRSLGVTGGEPFMVASMPDTVARLSQILPTVVLSNATLFHGPRLDRVTEALAGRDVHIQVSLDSPDPEVNDAGRGDDNFRDVTETVPVLVERGLKVRIATTSSGIAPDTLARLCALHRSWGIDDDDHVVRPIVARGRAAATEMGGVEAGRDELPAELCITADGAFWSAFGPTVVDGRLDTDLLVTRQTAPLSLPAETMVRIARGAPRGSDARLGIR